VLWRCGCGPSSAFCSSLAPLFFAEQINFWQRLMLDNSTHPHIDEFTSDPTMARLESHLLLGQQLLSSHATEKAIEQFRAALSLQPDHAESHAWMAVALADTKRFEAALHEIELALAGEPNNPFYTFVKGVVHSSTERWKEAQKYFEEAVALAPHVAKYHAHLA